MQHPPKHSFKNPAALTPTWVLVATLMALMLPVAPAAARDAEAGIPLKVFDKRAQQHGLDAKRLGKIVPMLQAEVERGLLPNAAVYIFRNGGLGWSVEMGYSNIADEKPINGKSIFRMFSMTKPLTAAAVMLLVEDGRLLLHDPVHKYLPEFKQMQVLVTAAGQKERRLEPAHRPIRVRDLLTHTDGLTYNFMPTSLAQDYTALGIEPGNPRPTGRKQPSLASMVSDLATLPLVHQPGAGWHYGVGLDVAGRVVEAVSGQGFAAFLENRLLEPLDMKDTHFSLSPRVARKRLTTLYQRTPPELAMVVADPPPGEANSAWAELPAVISGGGGLVGTGSDYANFANMLLNLGRHKNRQVLSRRSVEVLMSNHMSPAYGTGKLPLHATFSFNADSTVSGVGHGLGGAVYTNYGLSNRPLSPGTYTWGGAAGTDFWVDRQKNLTVVFLTQVLELGPGEVDQVQDRLANLIYQGLVD